MKKMMIRVFSIILVVAMFMTTVPLSVFAADSKTSNGYTFVWGTGKDMYYCVSKTNAPLRESKSESGKIIMRLEKNQLVKVVAVEKNWKGNTWLKIHYKNDANRVRGAYLYAGNATKYSCLVNEHREYAKRLYWTNGNYREWGVSETRAMDLANYARNKKCVEANLKYELFLRMYRAVGKSMDVSGYKTKTYYSYYDSKGVYRKNWGLYEKTGGCTWFAFNRFREVNGKDLIFKGAGGGNANTWDDRIVTNNFKKISASSITNGLMNAIGVDNQGSPIGGVYYGHVVYIELVHNGYVYYSEGWYNGSGFHSRLVKTSISNFAKTYETVIIPK